MLKHGENMYFKSQRNIIKLVASGKGTGRMENEREGYFALYTHLHLLNFESCKFFFFFFASQSRFNARCWMLGTGALG